MPYNSLRDWLEVAEKRGELLKISGAGWDLEMASIAEIINRESKGIRPALLFNDIPGYPKGYLTLQIKGKPHYGNIGLAKFPRYSLGTGHLAGVLGFSKKAWESVGKYPEMNVHEDLDFLRRLKRAEFLTHFILEPREIYYIYRYLCGWIQMSKKKEKWESNEEGTFEIEPQWYRDYYGESSKQLSRHFVK